MIDFPTLSLILMFGFVGLVMVLKIFNRGYEKEQKGERTDFLGRPSNHTSKENMD